MLGAKLFLVYTLPIGDMVRKRHEYGLNFYIFADDNQLYVIFQPTPEMAEKHTYKHVCIMYIVTLNFQNCNENKTVCMVISLKTKTFSLPLSNVDHDAVEKRHIHESY